MSYASCRAYINNLLTVILVIGPVYILYICAIYLLFLLVGTHILGTLPPA